MGRRVSIVVAVTCASLLSVGLAGTALAEKDTYIGGGASAEVKLKNDKQPKKIVRLDAFVEAYNGPAEASCDGDTFISAKFRDIRVKNDRFDATTSNGVIDIEGKFTRNANKFKAVLTSNESGCYSDQEVWFRPQPGKPPQAPPDY